MASEAVSALPFSLNKTNTNQPAFAMIPAGNKKGECKGTGTGPTGPLSMSMAGGNGEAE